MGENPEEEREVNFGIEQIEDFERSLVWKEIAATVQERIGINNGELQSMSDLNTILRAQGDLVACKFFLIQPEMLKRVVEEQKVDRKKKEELEKNE